MKQRIASIDVFRGIAVLQMIVFQIFDFFSEIDIYMDPPFYIPFFNMPINGIGVGLFAFISGVSIYLSLSNRLKKKMKKIEIFEHIIKRYGGYILLSLLFTTLVFGFEIFYEWREAVQGIGLAALIAALLLLLFRSKILLIGILLLTILVQPILLDSFQESSNSSFILNSTVLGWFSLVNILPFVLAGALLSAFLLNSNKKHLIKNSLIMGMAIILLSLLLHFSISEINYYGRSSSYQVLFIGLSFLLFGLIEFALLKFKETKTQKVLSLFGKTAIIAYIFHFAFIYKPLQLVNMDSTFDLFTSCLFTLLSILVICFISILYTKRDKS